MSAAQSGPRGAQRPVTRRDFLAALGLGAGTAALAACASSPRAAGAVTSTTTTTVAAASSPNAAPAAGPPLGVQLYTLRSLMARDVEGTLRLVADAGYKEVEFAGYHGRTPQQVRATLAALGLAAPSSHVPLDALRDRLDATLDAAAAVGHRYVILPYLEERDRTADSYRRVAGELNRWGEAARARGLRLGYHNHDFEFARLADGSRGLDLLLAGTDPALVAFEMDLYWTTFAGEDPKAYFARHPGRFELWHVKDLRRTAAGERQMVNVGEGGIDFRGLYAARAQAGVRHLVVEHDNPADPAASIRASYAGLRRAVG